MALTDVLSRTNIDTSFSAADRATITDVIRTSYNGSTTAKKVFDDWIATSTNTIQVNKVSGAFQAFPNTGIINIDLNYLTNASYIDNKGTAVQDTPTTAIVHELVHALTGRLDIPRSLNVPSDVKGDTVEFSNIIYKELGLPEQNSYFAYDNTGNIITRGFSYTNGVEIDRSVAGDQNWNSSGPLLDLLIGGPSANRLESGLGDDFLFGAGGDDFLNGGLFGTDTAVFTGNPVDYDIRLNDDGTWTSRHVRGTMNEGTDTLKNLEKVQYSSGKTFDLEKSGLDFQRDIVFVIDQTGSMADDIAAVQATANKTISDVFRGGTVDARFAVVGFRDNTIGEPTSVILPFTDQDLFADRQSAAINAINSISVSGGGDGPETSFDGLVQALNGTAGEWRLGAGRKDVVLFTDASAKDTALRSTVERLAADLEATITSRSSSVVENIGALDTFEVAFEGNVPGASGRDPFSEGDPLPTYEPSNDPIQAPEGTASVRIFTIFIDEFIDPDPDLVAVSEASGGEVLTAATPDEVVERLIEILDDGESSSNSPPVLPAQNGITFAENGTDPVFSAMGTDADGDTITYSLGPANNNRDQELFSVDASTGEVSFINPPDFENPLDRGDADGDNTYVVVLVAEDGNGGRTPQAYRVEVTDVNEGNAIEGTQRADFLRGTRGEDLIFGFGGRDNIQGRGGADSIDGGSGGDYLYGNGGNDWLFGGNGRDELFGESGRDTLNGGAGQDTLYGGRGRDLFVIDDIDRADTIRGFNPNQDRIELRISDDGGEAGLLRLSGFEFETDRDLGRVYERNLRLDTNGADQSGGFETILKIQSVEKNLNLNNMLDDGTITII